MVLMSLSLIIGAFYIVYCIISFFLSIHHFFTVEMIKICLAPMLDVTTPPFCNLVSLINPDVELFSEMLVDNMILNVDKLALDERAGSYPQNTVIQLGGSDCNKVSQAIQILIKYYGYTRYNLNCGCPSNKVKKGAFGASLIKDPANVASIINKVYNDTGIVISIKCRIGIVENKKEVIDMNSIEVNEDDDFEFFHRFVKTIMETTPCKTFYVHCRKCVLEGLSPKGNRNIPKLMYSYAHRIKAMYNDLEIIVNGGVKLPYKEHILDNCNGVMIGRMAMDDPFCFRSFSSVKEKEDFLLEIIPKYMSHLKVEKLRMYHILPILNLRKGMRNAKLYKQILIDGLKTKKGSKELCKLLIDHITENRRDEEILEQ